MKEQINFLINLINEIDNDPVKSMRFFTTAVSTTNITNKPPDNCRMNLIEEILLQHLCAFAQLPENDALKTVNYILNELNKKYEISQHLCWKSHEHHFHETFENYVNCPITCLCEISEFLAKLRI